MGEITPVTDHSIAEHLSHVPHAAALGMQLVGYEDGRALVREPEIRETRVARALPRGPVPDRRDFFGR